MFPMVERPALGQHVFLGDLYNIHTDQLCGLSILKVAPTYKFTNHSSTETTFYPDPPSTSVKMTHSFITAPQHQLSVLTGLCPVEASAKYLTTNKLTAKVVRASCRVVVNTKYEHLNILEEISAGHVIDLDILKKCGATHFVAKIKFGGIIYVVAESFDPFTPPYDRKKLENKLLLTLHNLANLKPKPKLSDNQGIVLNIYGDTMVRDDVSWDTIRQLLGTFVPGSVGIPIIMYLGPLNQIFPEITPELNDPEKLIELNFLELEFITLFDDLLKTKQRLYDLSAWGETERDVLIKELIKEFELGEIKLKMKLVNQLPVARQNPSVGLPRLKAILDDYRDQTHSPEWIKTRLDVLLQPQDLLSSKTHCGVKKKKMKNGGGKLSESEEQILSKKLDRLAAHFSILRGNTRTSSSNGSSLTCDKNEKRGREIGDDGNSNEEDFDLIQDLLIKVETSGSSDRPNGDLTPGDIWN